MRKRFTSNVKAFTDEPRKVKCNQSCKVAGCGLRPKSALQYAVDRILSQNATRNFHWFMFFALYLYTIYILYIYYYICIYIYILYNIIKNKKKSPPIGLHIHRRKNGCTPKVAGCVFGKNRLYSMLWLGFWAQPVTCNLATLVAFYVSAL